MATHKISASKETIKAIRRASVRRGAKFAAKGNRAVITIDNVIEVFLAAHCVTSQFSHTREDSHDMAVAEWL